MSDSLCSEDPLSDEHEVDKNKAKITAFERDGLATETDKYITGFLSTIETSKKIKCLSGFDRRMGKEWKEAFLRASLVDEPVRDTFSSGTAYTSRTTFETYILSDDGRSCISVCREDGCRRHADRMSKSGLVCPLASRSFYAKAANSSINFFCLKVAVALYILDKKLETLSPHDCWARFKTELQNEKEQLCYTEAGSRSHIHTLSSDNGVLSRNRYSAMDKNRGKSAVLCKADWCIRNSVSQWGDFCSRSCKLVSSVKPEPTTGLTSNPPKKSETKKDRGKMKDKRHLPDRHVTGRVTFKESSHMKPGTYKSKKPPFASKPKERSTYGVRPEAAHPFFAERFAPSSSDSD